MRTMTALTMSKNAEKYLSKIEIWPKLSSLGKPYKSSFFVARILRGGGGEALLAGPLKKELFVASKIKLFLVARPLRPPSPSSLVATFFGGCFLGLQRSS